MRIAVLGGGVMGESLIAGILRTLEPTPTVVVAEKRQERADELRDRYGVQTADLVAACTGADVVIVVVKPQDIRPVIAEIAPAIAAGAVIISIAAGITTSSIEAVVPQAHVVRAMPNTPARIDAGVSGVSAGVHCPPGSLDLALQVMGAVGVVIEIPESLQDAITAVSGSGPAYAFFLAESMLAGAREVGLPEEAARTAVVHTLLGAAKLLESSQTDPAELRANVTSPNGTTAAAVAVLEAEGVRDSFVRALVAARDRSKELSAT